MRTDTRRIAVLAATCAALGAAAPAASATKVEVVARGLENPRGMALDPHGALWVTEAGRGGAGPCTRATFQPREDVCFGPTGAVSRIDLRRGKQRRVVTGLPSHAATQRPDGTIGEPHGPHDIAFSPRGRPYLITGLHLPPAARAQLGPRGGEFARLYRLERGRARPIADLGAFEEAQNPDGDQPGTTVATNPYGLSAAAPGRRVVADASANTLLEVDRRGRTRTLAVFPVRFLPFQGQPVPSQHVPTEVQRGPDGAWYVSQLTGFPFPRGGASIVRVPSEGGTPEPHLGGFSLIIDFAFGRHGELYVVELADDIQRPRNGRLIRVDRDGTREELAAGRLEFPMSVAVGRRGAVYVTNKGLEPGAGEVLRIR